MFATSVTSFLIATIFEAAQLAATGIRIHTALAGNPGLSLANKLILVKGQLVKPNLIYNWTRTTEVRGLIERNLSSLVLNVNGDCRSSSVMGLLCGGSLFYSNIANG